MAQILMTVWPIETHITPFWALARALADRGHSVGFYTGCRYQWQTERQGFRCFPFQEVGERFMESIPAAGQQAGLSPAERRRVYRDFLLGAVREQIGDLDSIFRRWPPDMIVCDLTMWGPILVTQELRRLPLAVLCNPSYCMLAGHDNPVPWLSLPRLGSLPARLAGRVLGWAVNRATASIPREANQIRAEYGLPPLTGTVMEFTGQMPLHLVPGAREFDWDRVDVPPSVQYVGPCIWEEGESQEPPEWVARSRATQPDNGAERPVLPGLEATRPRIVVLEETHYSEDPALLRTAAAALSDYPADVVLMAGHGRQLDAMKLAPEAPNMRLVPWAPLNHALASADLMVAHGNSETVVAALSRGIPVVMVPRMLEQPQVAFRLSSSGAGLRLPMNRCTPESLRATVDRALKTPSYRLEALRIGAALRRAGGPSRAAALVEELLPVETNPGFSPYFAQSMK